MFMQEGAVALACKILHLVGVELWKVNRFIGALVDPKLLCHRICGVHLGALVSPTPHPSLQTSLFNSGKQI